MKYFLTIFLLSFCLNQLSAQEKHFIFIQSDTKQPFYVSLNGKLFSSTATGYVIIPKLVDGTYNFTVGFAQNTFPEQTFTCVIQNKDLGFELKNFNEKGWGLFNLQSLDITMALSGNSNLVAKALNESANKAAEPVISFDKKKDTSQVTNKQTEPAVSDSLVAKADEVKVDSTKVVSAVAESEKTTVINSSAANEAKLKDTVALDNVKKVSETAGEEGVHLSFVEGTGKTKDTINVIIPTTPAQANDVVSTPVATKSTTTNEGKTNRGNEGQTASNTNGDLKFLDINVGTKKDSSEVVAPQKENTRVMENSNCKNIATDDDYAKLRKKMATETTDEKMINEAKKYYRNKCFTTSQIKGLSTLFLSDEGRYKFFDASYVSVADASQYESLQTEFIDPAFVTRFKELLQ